LKLLDYRTLQAILANEFTTKKGTFNGRKKMPDEVYNSIVKYTDFLNYDAPVSTRVSYIVSNITAQLQCLECNGYIATTKNVLNASEFCSITCSRKSSRTKDRRAKTNTSRYGLSNPFLDSARIKQITQQKYGVDNVSKLDSVKKVISQKNKENASSRMLKAKASIQQKYGVDYISQAQAVKDKKRKSCLEKYGAPSFLTSAEGKAKIQKTLLKTYGTTNPNELALIKEKIKKTKTSRYGDPAYNNRTKATDTMLTLYGTHSSRRHWPDSSEELLNNKEYLIDRLATDTLSDIAEELQVSQHTVRAQLKKYKLYNPSSTQYEDCIENILQLHNIRYIKNDRKILEGLELDFYLLDYNLAIEVNGIYWHSELAGKNKHYHLNKTVMCNNKGIKLMHFWDYQIDQSADVVKSIVTNAINSTPNKVYARKTIVRELTSAENIQFFTKNHLQKAVNAKIKIGLEYNGEIIAAMSFGKSRFKSGEYELLRYANMCYYSVIGGASKLFAYFLNTNPDITSLISYANRDFSQGKLYDVLGFKLSGTTPPAYYYFKNRQVFNRVHFQKHKLSSILSVFDSNLTEWKNMQQNGYNRFWTTGNFKYEFNR